MACSTRGSFTPRAAICRATIFSRSELKSVMPVATKRAAGSFHVGLDAVGHLRGDGAGTEAVLLLGELAQGVHEALGIGLAVLGDQLVERLEGPQLFLDLFVLLERLDLGLGVGAD